MLRRSARAINSRESEPITSNAPPRLSASASNCVWSRVSSATSTRITASKVSSCISYFVRSGLFGRTLRRMGRVHA
jgi:hypothetical protein